jgi:hypothetical protein
VRPRRANQRWFDRLDLGGPVHRPLLGGVVVAIWIAAAVLSGWELSRLAGRESLRGSWFPTETIRRGDPGWERLRERFLAEFLSKDRRAVNPEVFTFRRHLFVPILGARADTSFVVENGTYGSRTRARIGEWVAFSGDAGGAVSWSTEGMEPTDAAQERRWDENRRRIYRGSLEHFLRALMHQRLREEGFQVLNPNDFVGMWRRNVAVFPVESSDHFVLVASPGLRVRVVGEPGTRAIWLPQGWLGVGLTGRVNGTYRPEGWDVMYEMPEPALDAYAAEQDSAWGRATKSIQQILTLE